MIKEIRAKLDTEVTTLEFELRVTLPREIKKALEHGDLRENSEYKSALERQEYVKLRLGQLLKRRSEIATMDFSRLPKDRIAYGSRVSVETEAGESVIYRLVLAEEADPDKGWISVQSPIGKSLVGRRDGDDVVVRTPGGTKRFTIVEIHTIHDEL